MGSMNFALFPLADRYKTWKYDWEEPYLADTDDYIFRNTFRDIARIIEHARRGLTARASSTSATTSAISTISPTSSIASWSSRPSSSRLIFGILGGIGADLRNLAAS